MFDFFEQPYTLIGATVLFLFGVLTFRSVLPEKSRWWQLLLPVFVAVAAFGLDTLVQTDLEKINSVISTGSNSTIYVDGALRGMETPTANPAGQTRWSIGQEWDSSDSSDPSDEYEGMVDDVRFYNYALSLGEVAWLAGMTEPFDKPF